MLVPTYDVKIDDKVIYTRIPEHSLNLWMDKAFKKFGKRPVAQARFNW